MRLLRTYVAAWVVAGAVPVAWALYGAATGEVHRGWILLAALTALCTQLAVRVPSVQSTLSLAEGFIFAAILLFGPAAGILTAALDGLLVSASSRRRRWDRMLFNATVPALSASLAAWIFYSLTGGSPLLGRHVAFAPIVPALLAMTSTYFIVNTFASGVAMWLEAQNCITALLRAHAQPLLLDFSIGVSFAFIVALSAADAGLGAVLILLPVLVSSHLSSRNVVARLEATNKHLTDLQRLYDSTIEALAMAVDAKDQVTHGHIRRVQVGCHDIASALAPDDELLLRALDAASLLHDLGKLIVPEHILNKPGPLTPAEFEQMKRHAAAGADMLSGIDFPFPVVPIVRHHHENWDGTGYPDGIAGEAIPLGARILAVVDCFDALTSDRPYRPRLSTAAALEIIAARRGRMYDPDVVDLLIAKQAGTAPAEEGVAPNHTATAAAGDARPSGLTAELRELVRTLSGAPWTVAAKLIAARAQEIVPGTIAVVFRYDAESDELIADDVPSSLFGAPSRRVSMGHGVSGWVGAHRRTMANSDAALDVGDAPPHAPALQVCLSVPALSRSTLAGVLTLYSAQAIFTERDRTRIEELAMAVGPVMARVTGGANGDRRRGEGHAPSSAA